MKGKVIGIAIIFGIILSCAYAEEGRWVWSGRHRRERDFQNERNEKFRDEVYARVDRDREPTTKRPTPGVPQNEEIDDYPDGDDKNNLGTRNYPFGQNGFNSGQFAGNGFNNYPGIGFGGNSAPNGILVGPGGPTGIIGRPQQYFPGANNGGFPGGFGQTGFGTNGGNLGLPQQQPGGFAGNGVNNFPNGFGQVQGYPGAQNGQYPGGFYNNGQFSAGQYPINNQFGGAQFPGVNNQYPNVNNQYPGGNHYPGGGPSFTEGYGLFTNNYPPLGGGFPQSSFGGFNGLGFDEHNQTNRRLQIEGKSASVESRNIVDTTINDKVSENLKKST